MKRQARKQFVTIMEVENSYCKSTQEEISLWNINKHDEVRKMDTAHSNQRRENSQLVIDETTIYEIDLNCYECLKNRRY